MVGVSLISGGQKRKRTLIKKDPVNLGERGRKLGDARRQFV